MINAAMSATTPRPSRSPYLVWWWLGRLSPPARSAISAIVPTTATTTKPPATKKAVALPGLGDPRYSAAISTAGGEMAASRASDAACSNNARLPVEMQVADDAGGGLLRAIADRHDHHARLARSGQFQVR